MTLHVNQEELREGGRVLGFKALIQRADQAADKKKL